MMSRIDSRHWKISTGCHLQNGHHNSAQIRYCPISTKISYLGRLWCPELIPDIEKFLPVTIFKMAATIPHKFNIVRFQCPKLIRNIEKFLPGLHFQNGHHNTAKIQHCSISKVAFNLFFKPVVSGRFGRLHNR